jgi:hypothetical protein
VRVLDLYSGLGGWSQPALDGGHEVTRVEWDQRLADTVPNTVRADITAVTADQLIELAGGKPDLILASPPCEAWSVMVLSRNWYPDYTPKSPRAEAAIQMVSHTLDLIRAIDPEFWVMENPRGMMRKHPVVAGLERRTVTYCHYGEKRMKPTDLWSDRWMPSLVLAPACKNGDPCHVRAPRGSMTGTQGMSGRQNGYWEKSLIPYPLARDVTDAAATDLEAGVPGSNLTLW